MSDSLDPSVLAAVKQAAEAATPLPWVHRSAMYDEVWGTRLVSESVEWPADAAYIVAACNAAPALIAEIERLTAQVEGITAGAKPCVLAESDD